MRPASVHSFDRIERLGYTSTLLMGLLWIALSTGCTTRPDSLELTPKDHVFTGVGTEMWFKALPKAENGKRFPKLQADVRWTTSDPNVVTIDRNGLSRAVGPGQAILTATLNDLKYDVRVEVRVIARIEPVESLLTLTLTTDETGEFIREGRAVEAVVYDTLDRRLEDSKPTLRCRDENVCRTSNDHVLPVDFGKTSLELRLENAIATIPVEVVPAPNATKKGSTKKH